MTSVSLSLSLSLSWLLTWVLLGHMRLQQSRMLRSSSLMQQNIGEGFSGSSITVVHICSGTKCVMHTAVNHRTTMLADSVNWTWQQRQASDLVRCLSLAVPSPINAGLACSHRCQGASDSVAKILVLRRCSRQVQASTEDCRWSSINITSTATNWSTTPLIRLVSVQLTASPLTLVYGRHLVASDKNKIFRERGRDY